MRSVTVLALALAALQNAPWAPRDRAYSAFSEDKARRFDFWIGTWDVNLRMLQNDGEFRDSVRARANIYSILDGKAVLELWDSVPIKGFSLRYYDPASAAWDLWLNWPSEDRSRTAKFTGRFRHGRADFFAERERDDGATVRLRYSFSDISPFSLRWDDHSSTDGGKTWRPNWIMEFSRTAREPRWPISRDETPTFTDGQRCRSGNFRAYEEIVGDWVGSFGVEGQREQAQLGAYRVLDGCAVILFLTAPSRSRFAFLTFDTTRQSWELDWLTSAPESKLERLFGADSWRELENEEGTMHFSWSPEGDQLNYVLSTGRAEESGSFQKTS
jgi:hypothetical protein